jgi:hypothetical protein
MHGKERNDNAWLDMAWKGKEMKGMALQDKA